MATIAPQTINIDTYISIKSAVVSDNSTAPTFAGNFLTDKVNIVPNGSSQVFTTLAEVLTVFGANTDEYRAAEVYFQGSTIARKNADMMVFSGFLPGAASAPVLLTGEISSANVTALKAIDDGVFTLEVDGTSYSTAPMNFSEDANLVNIAATLQAALRTAAAKPNLTVSVISNKLAINSGTIGSQYTLGYGKDNIVTPLLHANRQTGATISIGKDSLSATQIMDDIIAQNRNWVGFTSIVDYSTEENHTTYLELAAWTNAQNDKFIFIPWIKDSSGVKTLEFKQLIDTANYAKIWTMNGDYTHAAGGLGLGDTINYNDNNGRINFAWKSIGGLIPTVNNTAVAILMNKNKITYYGINSGRNQNDSRNFYFGCYLTGKFLNVGNFYDHIWLNDTMQSELLELLLNINNLPNNDDGIAIVTSVIKDVANKALVNGVIQVGSTFSQLIKLTLVQEAGVDISTQLTTNGYYLQIKRATSDQKASGIFGDINFWYTNGGSVLFFNIVNTLVI